MSRTVGDVSLALSLEPIVPAPLDARATVPTKAALIDANSFNGNAYNGMLVSVTSDAIPSNNTVYRLKDATSKTDANSWEEVGGGGGFAMDQNVRTTDGVTFATVNTGHGANELYAMDQAVRTTDVVRFAGLQVGPIYNYEYTFKDFTFLNEGFGVLASHHFILCSISTAATGTWDVYLHNVNDAETGKMVTIVTTTGGWNASRTLTIRTLPFDITIHNFPAGVILTGGSQSVTLMSVRSYVSGGVAGNIGWHVIGGRFG